MIHRISWRVATKGSLEFWAGRLDDYGVDATEGADSLRFADPEGLGLEIVLDPSGDFALRAAASAIPAQHALAGFEGARAYATSPAESDELLVDALGFESLEGGFRARGETRRSSWAYDPAPAEEGKTGPGIDVAVIVGKKRFRTKKIAQILPLPLPKPGELPKVCREG